MAIKPRIIGWILCVCPLFTFANMAWMSAKVSVCFTPGNACMSRAIDAIAHAQKTIDVQTYSFTSYRIAKALINAARRGVSVRVIADSSQLDCKSRSKIWWLKRMGISVWDDGQLRIAHNKVMIIDDSLVETGSFNFTYSAEHFNAENMVFIKSPSIAAQYQENWQNRFNHSKRVIEKRCRQISG